jgi:hypothetical protein
MYIQTYPNLLILGAGCEELAIGTEADAADVKVAVLVHILVLQGGHVLTGGYIKDLSGTVATRCEIFAVTTETDAANDAIMDKMMHKLDIEHALHLWVEYGVPIGALSLLRSRQVIRIPVGQHVSRAVTD